MSNEDSLEDKKQRMIKFLTTFKIDKAPGKDLINKIIEQQQFADLKEFYQIRIAWNNYPIIHDKILTYGIFDDLIKALPVDEIMLDKFIDYAIHIAKEESEDTFINSLFLLSNFCNEAVKLNLRPDQNRVNEIITLRIKVRRLASVANLFLFWNQILDYCSKNNVRVKRPWQDRSYGYKSFVDINFPSIDNNTPSSCPVTLQEIKNRVNNFTGEFEPLAFVRSAKIESDLYWVWSYNKIADSLYSFYIVVKQDGLGNITITTNRIREGEEVDVEMFLLNLHY